MKGQEGHQLQVASLTSDGALSSGHLTCGRFLAGHMQSTALIPDRYELRQEQSLGAAAESNWFSMQSALKAPGTSGSVRDAVGAWRCEGDLQMRKHLKPKAQMVQG